MKEAFGQYQIYLSFLKRLDPERKLCIAASDTAYAILNESLAVRMLLDDSGITIIVVDIEKKAIVEWKK